MTSSKMPRDGVRRRRPRLRDFDYRGGWRYLVTICAFENRRLFTPPWPYDETIRVLSSSAGQSGFHVCAYVFMPDHLHLLVAGDEGADLKEFVRLFKSRSSYHYKKGAGHPLWQRSYYDRVLRKDEDTRAVARYILNNPIRRGLARSAEAYPFIGSFVAPVADWL